MADYASRIASLKSEQARLAQRELELGAVRREEVGKLADRLGVLEAEDDVFSGLLLELKADGESKPASGPVARRGPEVSLR
jgi:hypothetical protein